MTLYEELLNEAEGEIRARDGYRKLADKLRVAGHPSEGNLADHIADEEDSHANLLMTMANSIRAKEGMEGGTFGRVPEPSLTDEIDKAYEHAKRTGEVTVSPFSEQRPFPQTYGDWVDLAEDIKAKCPNDPVMRADVNYQLQHISENTDSSDEAKRWLTTEAGKLGIK